MEGSDETCLYNFFECPGAQGQCLPDWRPPWRLAVGGGWEWGGWDLRQLILIKFHSSPIREIQIRMFSASFVTQMFPL